MLKRYLVKGHSMEPLFRAGDRLLVSPLFFKLKKDDVIVFSNGNKNYLKRIKKVSGNRFVVRGDSNGHGKEYAVNRNQIKGKFLMKY